MPCRWKFVIGAEAIREQELSVEDIEMRSRLREPRDGELGLKSLGTLRIHTFTGDFRVRPGREPGEPVSVGSLTGNEEEEH
eukprot:12789046-Heterocapsa_arctica.AAC.1